MRNLILYSILLLFVYFLPGCKEQEAIEIKEDPGVLTSICDTFTAELSTVLIDSLPTSNTSVLLEGKCEHAELGEISSTSFLQFSLTGNDTDADGKEDFFASDSDPVYDSIVLILYKSYLYGDENENHSFTVHRLTETISQRNRGAIFNGSSFAYETTPLATKNIYPSALDADAGYAIRVPLPESLGQEIFDYAKTKDLKVISSEHFKEYFKGIALVSDPGNESFLGYSTSPVIHLYYHNSTDPTVLYYEFKHNSGDLHSNGIANDRSTTSLATLKEIYDERASDKTNNMSFLVTGIELMPKIKFPSVFSFKQNYTYTLIQKAELKIYPKNNSYSPAYPLPSRLVLYQTDESNRPGNLMVDQKTGSVQIINPVIDYEDARNTVYTFDVTKFVQQQLELDSYSGDALLLASLQSESSGRSEIVILDAVDPTVKMKLTIYYTALN